MGKGGKKLSSILVVRSTENATPMHRNMGAKFRR